MKYVFQTDSDIVKQFREKEPNYIVEIDSNSSAKDLCVIYFTSNALYYPNTVERFKYSILTHNYYEWRHAAPISAYKQIFVRDIYKQWYLEGINSKVDTPSRLKELLKKETSGFRVITVGSSAGGYAAILYGSLLGAEKIFAFNPQFEINSLLATTTEDINPLLFRHINDKTLRKYYDILPMIGASPVYYFVSEKSEWDSQQQKHVGNHSGVRTIRFKSSHHGVPFPRIALSNVMTSSQEILDSLNGKSFSPIFFSIRFVGILRTVSGLMSQFISILRKRYNRGNK